MVQVREEEEEEEVRRSRCRVNRLSRSLSRMSSSVRSFIFFFRRGALLTDGATTTTGSIIGKGGQKINEIRQLSQCQIKICEPGDGSPGANPAERVRMPIFFLSLEGTLI